MTRRVLIGIVAAGLLASAAPALAQLPPVRQPRPTQGLFGGGIGGNTSTGVQVSGNLGAGYDDDLLAESTGSGGGVPSSPTAPKAGSFLGGSGSLSYTVSQEHFRASLAGAATMRYYGDLTNPFVNTYSGSGQVSTDLGKNKTTTLHAATRFGQQPHNSLIFYGSSFDPATAPPGAVDPASTIDLRTYTSFDGGAGVSQRISTRLSLEANYLFQSTDAFTGPTAQASYTQSISAGGTWDIGKGFGFRLAYVTHDSRYGVTGAQVPYRGRSIDGGLTFNKSLSITRRSFLNFATGMSALSDQLTTTRYFFTGHVNYGYELGRSWTLNAGYSRSIDFQILNQPVLLDYGTVGVQGLLSRRLQFNANVGASKGTGAIVVGTQGYTAGDVGASLQYGLTRELAISGRYSLYRYQFDQGAILPPGYSSNWNRQSVSISLNAWTSLFEHTRRPNATR